jgi:hypothetical protein
MDNLRACDGGDLPGNDDQYCGQCSHENYCDDQKPILCRPVGQVPARRSPKLKGGSDKEFGQAPGSEKDHPEKEQYRDLAWAKIEHRLSAELTLYRSR